MNLSLIEALAAVLLGTSAALASDAKERDLSHWTYVPTAPPVPTPKPTSPCTGSTPDWKDSYGDGCAWYEMMDSPGCPWYGDDYEGDMGVANDHCCYCAGTGSPVATPQPAPTTPVPTYAPWTLYPTAPVAPTPKPTSPCAGSTPDWADSHGDGCAWYEAVDRPGCPIYGNMYEGPMGVANDHCCYCFGTGSPVATPPTTPFPTYDPSTPFGPHPTWHPSTPFPTEPVVPTPFPTYAPS